MKPALGTFLALAALSCATPAPLQGGAAARRSHPFVVQNGPALRAALRSPTAATPASASPDTGPDPSTFWNRLTGELGISSRFSPPRLARAYALVHVAIHDALVIADPQAPGALQPRAVAAGAAATVLEALFNRERDRIAGEVAGQLEGVPAPERALELGRAVGRLVLDHGRNDGSTALTDTPASTGEGRWTGINPVLPEASAWKTWFLASPREFTPEPPYPLGSPEDLRELAEVQTVAANRTGQHIAIVHKWADVPPPTLWNDLLNERVARDHLTPLAAARAYAYLNAAMYDAFVSCWNTKYTWWVARPFQRLPSLHTVVPTPNFPTYTSGHATISGTASVVMSALFPSERDHFVAQAEEAAWSRLLGGIHFRHDNQAGLDVGRRIGQKVVALMDRDAAP